MRDVGTELSALLRYALRRIGGPRGPSAHLKGLGYLVAAFNLVVEEDYLDLDAIGLQHFHFRIQHGIFAAELPIAVVQHQDSQVFSRCRLTK
jgi:hypothetical protein